MWGVRGPAARLFSDAWHVPHRVPTSIACRSNVVLVPATGFCVPKWGPNSGRCGSTLLCKLLGQANGVISLSEPDIYT